MKLKKVGLFALNLILLAALGTAAWAQEEDESGKRDLIKTRTYIGFFGTSATIDQWGGFQGIHSFQAFNGSSSGSTLSTSIEVDMVPAISRNFGAEIMLGHREGPWAGELSFTRSDHTAVYYSSSNSGPVTTNESASLCSIDFDFKRYFLTTAPVQPFVSMGLSLPWLWIRNGSQLYDSAYNLVNTDDETISGIGFNLGAGLEVYLSQDFSLVGGVFQRWTGFDQISGVSKIPFNKLYFDGVSTDVGSIEGDGMHIYAGTTFGFQM